MIAILAMPSLAFALNGSGHYDDTAWSGLNDISGYNNISVDITPQVWASGNDGYYYSNNVVFTNNTNIYGGLQTNGFDGTRWIGKMAIFSIWDVSSGIAKPSGTLQALTLLSLTIRLLHFQLQAVQLLQNLNLPHLAK